MKTQTHYVGLRGNSATEELIAAIRRERELIPNSENTPRYRKLNVVNILLGAALFVGVVALIWGVSNGL